MQIEERLIQESIASCSEKLPPVKNEAGNKEKSYSVEDAISHGKAEERWFYCKIMDCCVFHVRKGKIWYQPVTGVEHDLDRC